MDRRDDDGSCADGGGLYRVPESRQQHRGGAASQRRILLLPLLLALGLFTVSSMCSKFLAPRGAGGRPDDNDARWARIPSSGS